MEATPIGGKCYEVPPVILEDHSPPIILFAVGNRIQIVSLTSGKLIAVYTKHTSNIVKIFSSFTTTIISGSEDGLISHWNVDTLIEIKSHQISSTILDFLIPNSNQDSVYFVTNSNVVLEVPKPAEVSSTVTQKYTLKVFSTVNNVVASTLCPMRFAVNCLGSLTTSNEEYVVAVTHTSLNIWSVRSSSFHVTFKTDSGPINCMAINSSQGVLATGHLKGVITVWHALDTVLGSIKSTSNPCVLTGKQRPTCTVFHWHSLPLYTLHFNSNGNFLFSGGEEGVLVQWQLSSGSKSFLPRLGDAISSTVVSAQEAWVVATTRDNAIQIIDMGRYSTFFML